MHWNAEQPAPNMQGASSMRALPVRAQIYLGSIWLLALLFFGIALLLLPGQLDPQIPQDLLTHLLIALIFAVMLAIADLTTFRLDNNRTVSIAVTLLIAALTAVNLQWALLFLIIALGTLSAGIAQAVPWWRILNTIAVRWLAVSLATSIAALTWNMQTPITVTGMLRPDTLHYTTLPAIVGLLVTGAVIYLVEQAAEAGLLAGSTGEPLRAAWRGRVDDLFWHSFVLASLGGLLATLWSINVFVFVLGIVPIVMVQRAFRSQVELSQSQDELNQRSSEMQNLAADYSALNNKLERLQSLATSLIATRDVQTMLETLCDRLAALLNASSGWVVLLDEQQTPQMVAWHNLPAEPDGPGPHPVPMPLSYEQVLRSRRVLVFAEDQRTMTLAPLPVLSENWFWRALIVIPLVGDEPTSVSEEPTSRTQRVLGAICLTFDQVRGLDKNEQRILTAFARQAGVSLENARLFLKVQESQAELIQSSKLAAVGTFAAGIAHEFNNLLAGMLGYAQLGLTTTELKEKNEAFKVVVDACKRGKSITGSLLTFARRQEPRRELGDVRGAVEDTLTLMEIELRKCNITVERAITPVPSTVCDLGQISQVFLNLLTNARDAMRADGGKLFVSLTSSDTMITLCVRDTGCGIPDAIRDKIFEPFVTTKGALSGSRTPGTGLGLSVSYGIIKDHGGTITIESTEGAGTSVSVCLPVTSVEQSVPQEMVKSENGHLPPLHMLIVDDDPTIGDMLQRLLERTGHRIVVAQDGTTALRLYHRERFDLVLTDLSMPEMSGVELVRQLRAYDPEALILLFTGQALEEQIDQALKAGAVTVLYKPFELEDFLQAVSRAWKQRLPAQQPDPVSVQSRQQGR